MSVAFFIVLDRDDVGFDTFVNGKAVAHYLDPLQRFCEKHRLNTVEDFVSQDMSAFMDDFDDIHMPEQEVIWFESEAGLLWLDALIEKLHMDPAAEFPSALIIEDLEEYRNVLIKAQRIDAKWHFEIDI